MRARAATDAPDGINRRAACGRPVLPLLLDHLHRAVGAMLLAERARMLLLVRQASGLPAGGDRRPPDLRLRLLLLRETADRPRGADLPAPRAVLLAKPAREIHHWHHCPGQSILERRRLEDFRWTLRHAQVAPRAPRPQTRPAIRPRRRDRRLPRAIKKG